MGSEVQLELAGFSRRKLYRIPQNEDRDFNVDGGLTGGFKENFIFYELLISNREQTLGFFRGDYFGGKLVGVTRQTMKNS